LGANPEWKKAASCRPIRCWPLGRRWGCFASRALPSAQADRIVAQRPCPPESPRRRRRHDGRRLAPVVRSESPAAARDPSRWGQLGCVLGCGCLRRQGPGAAARRCEWSGPPGEEFAPDISASAGLARRSRPRVAGPVAREGMCGERSPLPRTIATSRGDDNRGGPRQQTRRRPAFGQDR
jgi:hypothetical protein